MGAGEIPAHSLVVTGLTQENTVKTLIAITAALALTACTSPVPSNFDFTHVRTGEEPTADQRRAGEFALFTLGATGITAAAGIPKPF